MSKRNINSDLSWELQGKLGQLQFAKVVVRLAPKIRRFKPGAQYQPSRQQEALRLADQICGEIARLERMVHSIYYAEMHHIKERKK